MGKSYAPAPMPDYAGIMAAQSASQASNQQAQIAQQQLDWAKQQYNQSQGQIQPIIDSMVTGMNNQNAFTQQQQQFYTQNYQPLEQQFIKEANDWASPERMEQQAGMAGADVAQQYDGARQAAAQSLRDYGVDPSSGRYAATDLASRVSQAAATAGAENMSRQNTQLQGLQLQQQAINTGRGYPGNINAGYGGAAGTGQGAVGSLNNSMMTGSQMMGSPTQWAGLGNQALGMWGNQASNNYGNYLQGYQYANTPMSSGWGSALGLAGGIALSKYAEGGPVPPMASPSGGAAVDDVPARVNVGEFIMPKEAVSWFGEKAMHDMILKAQKQRAETEQQSGAVPDVTPANSNERPSLISGQRAAIPVR